MCGEKHSYGHLGAVPALTLPSHCPPLPLVHSQASSKPGEVQELLAVHLTLGRAWAAVTPPNLLLVHRLLQCPGLAGFGLGHLQLCVPHSCVGHGGSAAATENHILQHSFPGLRQM